MVPVKTEETGFNKSLSSALTKYLTLVNEIDESEKPNDWDELQSRLKQLISGIIRAVDSEKEGMRHSAYSSIKHQLDGHKTSKTEISALACEDNYCVVDKDTVFYRMRKAAPEERKKMKRKDLFHVPLDKRGLVATERYSVPGYPCLYLSHKVFGCWEEMGRPDFGTIMVSALKSQEEFKVLDLRIPSLSKWETGFRQCLLFFPLIIASMVQVKSSTDTYKPEYTIPQLLTEWVISRNSNNKGELVLGIAYTSAQKNDDFDYPDDSYDNYAIPILSPKSKTKYCPKLKSFFTMTQPTYYDLEVLRQGQIIDEGNYDNKTTDQVKEENMGVSPFGIMEMYLRKYPYEAVEE